MKKKILLIDDESSLRRSLSLSLTQRGYDTEPCENGVSGLKKMESFIKSNIHLDGIVVDLKLPDIDGINLIKIMKFRCPGVPIIVITGYADRYNMDEIKNLKVSAFLEKPFTADELVNEFVKIVEEQNKNKIVDVKREKEEAVTKSAYLLMQVDEELDYFKTYQQLYYMDNVVYCDATKGDYDIILLVQSESIEKLEEIVETKIKKVEGVKSVELLEVSDPLLDNDTKEILQDIEDSLKNESSFSNKGRKMEQRVCSYILLDVEKEKIDNVFPILKLNDNVIYCDYTSGKYNLVLFVTGSYFNEIDHFISQKITSLEGVLKVKKYPIINLFEM